MTAEQEKLKTHFLDPEVRDGVPVSAELKAAWKVMLDILEELIRVCKKYDLHYSMDGGSLLGAIRHKGFIPWDDDVDVAMPRKDYDRLIEVLPRELPDYYFVQTSLTDPEFSVPLLKIRDSRTTGIDPFHANSRCRFNMGIMVDVIPIDPKPDSIVKRAFVARRSFAFKGLRRHAFNRQPAGMRSIVSKWIGKTCLAVFGNERLYNWREQPFRGGMRRGYSACATNPAQYGWTHENHREWVWFEEYEEVPFEYLTVVVPKAYDKILTQIYGSDWRTPRRMAAYHGALILDTKRSYREVLIERFNYSQNEI